MTAPVRAAGGGPSPEPRWRPDFTLLLLVILAIAIITFLTF